MNKNILRMVGMISVVILTAISLVNCSSSNLLTPNIQSPDFVNKELAGGTGLPINDANYLGFFEYYGVNPFIMTEDYIFSTFGIDVDTVSYAITKQFLENGNLPDKDLIRTEEFINYFDQDYPYSDDVFTISIEGAQSQFGQSNYHLIKIGIKARDISLDNRKPANMVFVINVSSSMQREDKIEQVKISLRKLTENLKEGDRLGLVVYGNNGKIISQLTSNKEKIYNAIDQIVKEGSTYAEKGLTLGYEVARNGFEPEKTNTIILCSDGVANVGQTGPDSIKRVIKSEAVNGITLTVLGFGMGNDNDVLMEQLANDGNGSYYYINTESDADKIVGDGAIALLHTLAMNSIIQVEFNEDTVECYRLLGNENWHLEKEGDEDNSVDAGQSITTLYEIKIKDNAFGNSSAIIATIKIRYKNVETNKIEISEKSIDVQEMNREFEKASPMFRFTASVAEFAEILKKSYWAKYSNLAEVNKVAKSAVDDMEGGNTNMDDFNEFIDMVSKAIRVEDK